MPPPLPGTSPSACSPRPCMHCSTPAAAPACLLTRGRRALPDSSMTASIAGAGSTVRVRCRRRSRGRPSSGPLNTRARAWPDRYERGIRTRHRVIKPSEKDVSGWGTGTRSPVRRRPSTPVAGASWSWSVPSRAGAGRRRPGASCEVLRDDGREVLTGSPSAPSSSMGVHTTTSAVLPLAAQCPEAATKPTNGAPPRPRLRDVDGSAGAPRAGAAGIEHVKGLDGRQVRLVVTAHVGVVTSCDSAQFPPPRRVLHGRCPAGDVSGPARQRGPGQRPSTGCGRQGPRARCCPAGAR